ncbi:MAG: methylmalonyl-CoA epimerase [Armatimonadetes bacterium]|nr:methylmalonyl-CoA epimerase [Anaerolineae bacterium]
MSPLKINHIAVVVTDLDAALPFWQTALGLPLQRTEHNPDEAVSIAFLPVGDSEIELLAPTDAESGVAKYLAKNGGGLHHICLEVADMQAALAQLTAHGITLINEQPRTRPDGVLYAFVHPKSTGGVLVELYQMRANAE